VKTTTTTTTTAAAAEINTGHPRRAKSSGGVPMYCRWQDKEYMKDRDTESVARSGAPKQNYTMDYYDAIGK